MDKQLTGIQKASEEAERRKEEVEAQLTEMFADHDKAVVSVSFAFKMLEISFCSLLDLFQQFCFSC